MKEFIKLINSSERERIMEEHQLDSRFKFTIGFWVIAMLAIIYLILN